MGWVQTHQVIGTEKASFPFARQLNVNHCQIEMRWVTRHHRYADCNVMHQYFFLFPNIWIDNGNPKDRSG
jgi:hypothetical protein